MIDFANLVRGVRRDVDCEALCRFAMKHGRVAAANAYADWSADTASCYPPAPHGLGVEPVQLAGRPDGAHGVCVTMATDALEPMWPTPQDSGHNGPLPCQPRRLVRRDRPPDPATCVPPAAAA